MSLALLGAGKGTDAAGAALSYAQTIAAEPELVSFWKLLEPSGTAAADSKGSNAGVYTGSPTLNQSPLVTGGDKAVLFSGTGQYVAVAGTASLQVASITVEAWIKPTGAAPVSKSIIAIADGCFNLNTDGSGHAQVSFWNGTTNRVKSGTTVLAAATLFHVAGSFDDATGALTVFVNGVLEGQSIFATEHIGYDASTESEIAAGLSGAAPVAATLDDVAVYNAALAESRLLGHYNKGLSG